MPTFPRSTGARPRLAPPGRFPGALQSWGNTGKGQVRATQAMGRMWTEVYPVLDTSTANVRALLEAINRSLREPILWDVQHPYWHQRLGAAGGAPLVMGAGQTGSTINIDGATPSVTNWLRQGDLVKIAGCPVVLDVTADVNSNGSGVVALPISPPIFAGQSPADNAVVTVDPAAIFFKAYLVDVGEFPEIDANRYMNPGLQLTWREQPA